MDTVVRIGVILVAEIARVIKRPANVMIMDVRTGFMALPVINLVAQTVYRDVKDTAIDVLIVLRVITVICAINHVQTNAKDLSAIRIPDYVFMGVKMTTMEIIVSVSATLFLTRI